METLTLNFSPCPNDTFMFDAMVHQKIDTEGLSFDYHFADIEELNQRAFRNEPDITKISFHAFLYLTKNYILLNSGSALGRNCGPLVIAKRNISLSDLMNCRVAIPGKFTTANLLLTLANPQINDKPEIIFSDIEQAILDEKVDAGLIIHESRFTYQTKGLKKVIDLGEWWEKTTSCPIPLGGIIAKRSLPKETLLKINRVMQKSVEYAFAHPESSRDFVKSHAQEMDEKVMQQHIQLYVNDFSVALGGEGKNAITILVQKAKDCGMIAGAVDDDLIVA
ncbi:MAG TPA: 1,4-dihydroxy-6-naphthoate synthase [Bacteroidales bacterium]|nr:1,4-dihydroxy-6-naphthoate synthase [Bacteroidales bacterium]